MSAVLNRFLIDVDSISKPAPLVAQNDYHDVAMNKPCNCGDCLAFALVYGVTRCVRIPGPDGELMWVPELCEGDTAIFCFSADHVRKTFTGQCNGDIKTFASAIITNGWKAARKELAGPTFHIFDKKRKVPPKEVTPPTPKKANTAMSASSMMPAASADDDVPDLE